MGYFDRVLGRKPKDVKGEEEAASSSADSPSSSSSPVSTPEMVLDSSSGASSSYGPPAISSGSLGASPLSSMMPSFPAAGAGMGGGGSGGGGPAQRLYDPYEGISQSAMGVRKQMFKLPQQPEFLFEEEAAGRRGWGENLQFYVGLGYITGTTVLGRSCNIMQHHVPATVCNSITSLHNRLSHFSV